MLRIDSVGNIQLNFNLYVQVNSSGSLTQLGTGDSFVYTIDDDSKFFNMMELLLMKFI